MSFLVYDISFLVVFSLVVAVFLYKRRKKLEKEGLLFLYRTKIGIKFIDYVGEKYKNFLGILKYFVIVSGYLLMIGMLFLLGQLAYFFIKFPEIIRNIKIPPVFPLIPYLPSLFKVDFLPPFYFTYWIVAIAVVAVFHEFSHGIFSKYAGIKIKSTGFGFLGPFLAAFVEPDEEKIKKINKKDQIAILCAGSFANIILAGIFFLMFWLFFISFFTPSGIIFNTYAFTSINSSQIDNIVENNLIINSMNLTKVQIDDKIYFVNSDDLNKKNEFIAYENTPAINAGLEGIIIKINDVKIKDNSELVNELSKYKPGDKIKIITLVDDSEKEFEITLVEHPINKNASYIGIAMFDLSSSGFLGKIRDKLVFFRKPNTYYAPNTNPDFVIFIYNLLWWVILINISVALINMLPVGIFDGGRVFYLTVLAVTKSEKISSKAFKLITYLILFVFLILMLLWFFSIFWLFLPTVFFTGLK